MKIYFEGQYGGACETLDNSTQWVRIATFGDVPNMTADGRTVTQRFEREDAERIVAAFNANWQKLKRLLKVGSGDIPVVRGHTDTGNVDESTLVDSTQYGRIVALEVRDDGLYAQIDKGGSWGEMLANAGHLEYSPTWRVAETEPGSDVFRPFRLISVGMVPKGNLKNATLVNSFRGGNEPAENNQEQSDETDMEWTDEQMARLAQILGVEAEVLGDAEAVITQVSAKLGDTPPEEQEDQKTAANEENTEDDDEKKKKMKEDAKVLVNEAFADSVILANEVVAMRELAEQDFEGAKAMISERREKQAKQPQSTTLQNAAKAAKKAEKTAEDRTRKIMSLVNSKIADMKARGLTPPKSHVLWANCAAEVDKD